jgi:hypothetical protein
VAPYGARAGERTKRNRLLFGRENVLRDLRLVVGRGVAVDHVTFHCTVQSRTVRNSGRTGLLGVSTRGRLGDRFVEGLQAGLDSLVARGIAQGFTGGFDCGLGIGHGRN